jgi:hypothetical protein
MRPYLKPVVRFELTDEDTNQSLWTSFGKKFG